MNYGSMKATYANYQNVLSFLITLELLYCIFLGKQFLFVFILYYLKHLLPCNDFVYTFYDMSHLYYCLTLNIIKFVI